MRSATSFLAIAAFLLATAAPALGVQGATVAGSYQYSPFAQTPTREVSIQAHRSGDSVRGSYEWTSLVDGVTRTGEVTCLVVDGSDAWLAGRETQTTGQPASGAFFRIDDGGAPGVTHDAAVAWIADPGQQLDELEAWCTDRNSEIPLFELDSGNLIVLEV